VRAAGIDLGSRTVKLAVIQDGRLSHFRVEDATYDPLAVCRAVLDGVLYDRITATGYGRHLFARHFDAQVVTEIAAAARGARHLLPTCRTVLDVGGQDTKAISLDAGGKVGKFSMNDRCAAGTGRSLEVMATALSLSREELVQEALAADRGERLSSMCAVFAESEVVSLLARGADRREIALGLHEAMAARVISLLSSVPLEDDLLFVGGGAHNACLRREIEARLKRPVLVPEEPQIVVALGAALG
jgi:predicted CoA-substrate-specific enzyme activase